ncbi:hypothetical protein [Corynebacterium pilosum]|uniref:Uncharacterized protein n=1 Tax=Corynebacterium pilosum TaxID=35756 RepID=A0A376CJ97_9CORY|nr:hypothetical protein [Corynebacterium pilosum]STC68504.1 Uncharacterised protein [Corynebacterium pilosum]
MSFLKRLFSGDDNEDQSPNHPELDPQLKKPVVKPEHEAALIEPHAGPAIAGENLNDQTLPEDSAEPVARIDSIGADELTADDARLIVSAIQTLEKAGLTPRAEVEPEDIEDALSDDVELFRRRPIVSLLASRDPAGELMFNRVFADDDQLLRCSNDDLLDFLEEASTAAGSDAYISDVVFFEDTEDPTRGSMRFQVGEWNVRDIEYHLDPDFGAVDAEADLLEAVAMDGQVATTFEGAFHRHAITLWLDPTTPESADLVAAIEAELQR